MAGIGPGAKEYVIPMAMQAINEAKVLVGGTRALNEFSHQGQKTFAIQADISAVMDFIKGGIKVTINTDDPAIEGTTLPQEFEYLKNSFGLTQKQVRLLCNNAIDAAFTSEQTKQKLRQIIIQQETL